MPKHSEPAMLRATISRGIPWAQKERLRKPWTASISTRDLSVLMRNSPRWCSWIGIVSRASALHRSKGRAHKCHQMPPVEVAERRFATGVVAAGEFDGLEIDVALAHFGDDVLRVLRQEREIVSGKNDHALARIARVLVEIGGGAGGAQQGSQLVPGDGRGQAFLDMARGLPGPDDVGKIGGSVIEGRDLDARLVGGAEKCVTRSQAGADDAEFSVALRLEPIEAAAQIDHALARGVERASKVRGNGVVRALNLGGLANVVVGEAHAQGG